MTKKIEQIICKCEICGEEKITTDAKEAITFANKHIASCMDEPPDFVESECPKCGE